MINFILLKNDLKIALANKSAILPPLIIFINIVLILTFAMKIGFNENKYLTSSILIIGVIFANIFNSNFLFETDLTDGTLESLVTAGLPISLILIVKFISSWIITNLPIILLLPVMHLIFSISFIKLPLLILAILLITIPVSIFCNFTSLLTLLINKNNAVIMLVLIPFIIPIVIFGQTLLDTILSGEYTNLFQPIQFLLALILLFTPIIILLGRILITDTLINN